MPAKVFVDTNVLVYARDASEPDKQPRAAEWLSHLWQSRTGSVSAQVLEEYYVTVTRKLKPGMPARAARLDVRSLAAWRPVPIDGDVLEGAFELEDRYRLSFWDALIIAAAEVGGCRYVLTEDLQEGQVLAGIKVVNPFLHAPTRDAL